MPTAFARPRRLRRLLIAALLPLGLLAWSGPGASASTALSSSDFRDVTIPKGGGEPSIALDTFAGSPGFGNMYVVSPESLTLYRSTDGGATFAAGPAVDANGPVRGGDTDVTVAPGGNVLVADLDVSHAWIQVSSDQGKTLNSGTPTAPEDDRPWLTAASGSVVYVAYHDFVGEVPVVCTSTDGGNTFPTCFQAFGPHQSAPQCAENTVPSRSLAVDPTDGSLNFMYSCSTAQENAQDPPYGPLHDYYLAHSAAVVQGQAPVYTTSTVFQADTSNGKAPNYANIFSAFRIDSAGNYYALFTGTADDANVLANPYHVYLTTSKDKGQTWTKPVQVDQPADPANPGTNVLADMAVTTPGNVDIAWYHSDFTGEPNGACGGTVPNTVGTASCTKQQNPFPPHTAANAPGWNVQMAQSTNALDAAPAFAQAIVNTNYTHYGQICTNGIVCGSSDRSLLDFLSIQVDCSGHAAIAYPANDKAETQTDTHVATQQSGSALTPPPACTAPAAAVPEVPMTPLLLAAGAAGLAGVAVIETRRRRRGAVVG